MRLAPIARSLGGLLLVLAAFGLLPLGMDAVEGRPWWPWATMVATAVSIGAALWWLGTRRAEQMGLREGIAVTSLTWMVASLCSGIGIWLASPAGFVESWFEAMSGFTTTGSSIFGGAADHPYAIENQTPGLLLWRSLMQWMGGIGIVVISLALLPLLVSGSGFQVYRAEVPGIDADRLAPRIRDTARILLRVYLLLTVMIIVGLLSCGISGFDAINHAMTCVSTGGFSTKDASAEGLTSSAAEWVLIAGMLIAGLNFGLLVHALRGKPLRLWRSAETRLYVCLTCLASVVVIGSLLLEGGIYGGRSGDLVRDAVFQVVSLITSTGYGSGFDAAAEGWEAWPPLSVMILIGLMIGGACAGSTGGGIKLVRLLLAWKAARRELRRFVEPARITPIHIDGHVVRDQVILQVAAFLIIFALCWLAGTIAICAGGTDPFTAGSAALSCLSNIGPGVGQVGAADNFRPLGWSGQVVCILLMLIGRLELFGVLMLLRPRHWRR